jgi:hypothetical protein
LVHTFLGLAQNSFEKQQTVTWRISKEFLENPGNVPTNRRKGVKIQKRILHELPVF